MASAALLAFTSLAPAAGAVAIPPTPYFYVRDAPLTRNQTVQLGFIQASGDGIAQRLVSNDSALNGDGSLTNGVVFPESGDWTLASGADGPRTIYGRIKYASGLWSDLVHLDLDLVTGTASSLYMDLDPQPTEGWSKLRLPSNRDWHGRSKTPGQRFFGYSIPTDSTSPVGFTVDDGSWSVSFVSQQAPLAPGTYTIGVGVNGDVGASNFSSCSANGGTFTVHAIEFASSGDIRTADVDFRLLCGTYVMAGSVRYGSGRATVALDQNHDSFTFPATAIGVPTQSKSVTFSNIGDTPATFGQASFVDAGNFPAPGDYEITSDTCSGATLQVGGTCTISARLTATQRSYRHAVLSVPDGTARGSRKVLFLGYGLQPTTLDLTVQAPPLVAPGPFTFVVTITPPPEPDAPGLKIDGSQKFGPTVSNLSNPTRRVYTYSVSLAPGTHTATASYVGGASGFMSSSAGPIEFTVTGDATPPSGSITINGGAQFTKSANVVLAVPASDAQSAVTQVALSGDATLSWWDIRDYAPSQDWNVGSGDGQKTVYAKWKNNAGVWSSVKSATIVVDTTPPTVAAPGIGFVEGSSIRDGRIKLRVPWSGSDAGSGIASFALGQQTDAGSWNLVAASVASPGTDRMLQPQHTYGFRVRGTDKATNASGWVYGPQFQLKRYQEGSASISYAGTWKAARSTAFWGGRAKKSGAGGSTASLTFTGRGFAWIARTGPDRGRAEVYVNGSLVDTVDLYAPTFGNKRVVWANTWTTASARTVSIRVLGTATRPRVDIDAFATLK